MTARSIRTITAGAFVIAASAHVMWWTRPAGAQTNRETTWRGRTPWGDPDLHGEWTTEGEYGVPFERPAQFGTRQFLNDEEYGRRLDDIRVRDDQDLARVDVLSGRVQGALEYPRGWLDLGLGWLEDGVPGGCGPGRERLAEVAVTGVFGG